MLSLHHQLIKVNKYLEGETKVKDTFNHNLNQCQNNIL